MAKPSAEEITGVLVCWLQEEVVNSDRNLNAYLSDFDKRRDDFYKSIDDPSNFNAQKALSHDFRMKEFAEGYAASSTWRDDRMASKLIFASLMMVSGSYRKQCYLEAGSEADYHDRRHQRGPTGINVSNVVSTELAAWDDNMPEEELVAKAIAKTHTVRDAIFDMHLSIHTWTQHHEQLPNGAIAGPDSEPVRAMRDSQRLAVGLAVAHTSVAASLRGGQYEKVPFLSPTTIGEATIIYPFAA